MGQATKLCQWAAARLPPKVASTIATATTQFQRRLITIPLFMLSWKECAIFYRESYYWGQIFPITLILLSIVLPKARSKRPEKGKVEASKEGEEVKGTDKLPAEEVKGSDKLPVEEDKKQVEGE